MIQNRSFSQPKDTPYGLRKIARGCRSNKWIISILNKKIHSKLGRNLLLYVKYDLSGKYKSFRILDENDKVLKQIFGKNSGSQFHIVNIC